MKFPDGVVIKKVDGNSEHNSFALDTSGCIWVMGMKFVFFGYYDDEEDVEEDALPEMCSEYKEASVPAKMDWFEKNGFTVIDFAAGETTIVIMKV